MLLMALLIYICNLITKAIKKGDNFTKTTIAKCAEMHVLSYSYISKK